MRKLLSISGGGHYERLRGKADRFGKYEAAAKVAEWQGVDERNIADLLLRAAWCCVDERDTEAERFFRGPWFG